ncbi:hypothetical protein PR003_g7078 [Phytophthora rubi]|uniref:NADH-ubiquinone oxidoreductase 21kDa subunit N-terminal domain-containing protein n=1 Tax=Phytophthora rubi TaxID=129364 RepID=A0A6A3L2D0_9STRA|nr:hypothetical protein PR001_g15307 [Phytophthora rubi]KAE9347118.1 hypothetical protein PR003_g7078 [Phytophthora rubi]
MSVPEHQVTCLIPSALLPKRDNCYMKYLIYTKGRPVGPRPRCGCPRYAATRHPRVTRPAQEAQDKAYPTQHGLDLATARKSNVAEFFMLSLYDFNGLAVKHERPELHDPHVPRFPVLYKEPTFQQVRDSVSQADLIQSAALGVVSFPLGYTVGACWTTSY